MGSSMTSQPGPADRGESRHTEPSLSIKQVSRRLNVAYNTVRNAILAGRLTAFRIQGAYRIREEDLAAYLETCRVTARGREARPPALKTTTLKHLDGAQLRAAWTRQGVRVPPTGGGSARSSGSTGGPSTGPAS